jgi:hypothetical protein
MIIIHRMNRVPLPRALELPLRNAARTMPVVVVTGARQTGKSTLVRDLAPAGELAVLTRISHSPFRHPEPRRRRRISSYVT